MKKIVTITEMQSIIHETKRLEGASFKNIKELLVSVIAAIEQSGKWEYVQYISGNPSLFVIKEVKPADTNNISYATPNMMEEIESFYADTSKKDMHIIEDKNDTKKHSDDKNSTQSDGNMFPEIKLPW